MDLGLKASFMYWYPAQSGTFGSSPWVKEIEKVIPTNSATQRMPQSSNHEVASRSQTELLKYPNK
jgi:hypothetical protein